MKSVSRGKAMVPESTESRSPFAGAKVLIVDDVPKNIQMLGSVLRGEGYQVIPATSGEQTLRAVETHRPDLILLDVMMPEMNGHEVIQRLRDDPEVRDIPVIFVTALTDEDDEKTGLDLGAVDYITKPINIPITLARVKTHLNLRFARRELEEQNQQLIEAAQLREDVERITRHDLKNPLQMIVGAPAVIRLDDNLTEQQLSMLDGITDAGYRMLEMINRSLDLYKMERGVYQLKPTAVDITQVIHRIFGETKRLAELRDSALELMVEGEPLAEGEVIEVLGEELLCYSLLANLVKNALEASPEGERVTITLSAGEMHRIRIHNMGAVPEEIRDRFFDKYATAGKEKGTGLGTYSARLITETQGGQIAMETSVTEGTTLTVSLRRADRSD
jgi:CheY-like chemotaxis protein